LENVFYISFLALNILGFLMTSFDKHQAKSGRWRVPEKRFFILGLLGGATGILIGMKVVRHKTKHSLFTIGMPLLVVVNLIFYYVIVDKEVQLWLRMI